MRKFTLTIFSWLFIFSFLLSFASATPSGASISVEGSERVNTTTASSNEALAGNITELEIYVGAAESQTWQGYYGNVSGGLTLSDSSDNVMYNWSVVSPEGEVYASTNSTVEWTDIQCFNFTASGTYTDESGNGGSTNLHGTNASILEEMFGISSTDIDGINETFSAQNHDSFYTASLEFTENQCQSVQLLTNTGAVDGTFEEILLYEPTTKSVVFTSILENSLTSFNGKQNDFQMIVPEDGHGADVAITEYYFFIEIE